ncbi:unnamed protein product [Prorocentrum cordatum]|uniref:Subtilisin n=1 Tax=Prorocentrum cordatum TaxID=2364126 RepID=A0ABN9WFX4_9DINO|nr:unnamed protein product [Polarella glacialis]
MSFCSPACSWPAASSLAFAADVELMQMSTTGTNASRQSLSASSAVVSHTAAGLKSWLCTLSSGATADEVKAVCNEFQGPFCAGTEECPPGTKCPEKFVHGFLTEADKDATIAKYPSLVVTCEEDPFVKEAWEHTVPDAATRRTGATLLMKLKAGSSTFQYDSSYWTNGSSVLNAASGASSSD